ncbi:MAG: SCO family protein, partial [Lamprobacter sp.]|uniref:SCO family protein n=1 Tax=Lamprobacter sp. TaxID=3100796 RepID=UPI002B25AF2A
HSGSAMSKLVPIIAILFLGMLLIWLLLGWEPVSVDPVSHETLGLDARPIGGEFELISAQGPLRLSDYQGKVVLLYFGYTQCPDICPTNLAIMAIALRDLDRSLGKDALDRVQVLFVSVDPERDTVERLADYVGYFHPRMIGLTGSPQALAGVARQYGAAYQRSDAGSSAMGYTVDHSAYTYVIDASGRLAEVLDHATPAEQIVAILRRHLAGASQAQTEPNLK